jgi:hypothetical protein
MNYQECPHYDEILQLLTEGRDFEDISFEIDEVEGCKNCSGPHGVCALWVILTFVENMKPQMSISDARATIDNLEEQLKKIVLQLLRDSASRQARDN